MMRENEFVHIMNRPDEFSPVTVEIARRMKNMSTSGFLSSGFRIARCSKCGCNSDIWLSDVRTCESFCKYCLAEKLSSELMENVEWKKKEMVFNLRKARERRAKEKEEVLKR